MKKDIYTHEFDIQSTATTEKKPRKEDKFTPSSLRLAGDPQKNGAGEPAPVHRIK